MEVARGCLRRRGARRGGAELGAAAGYRFEPIDQAQQLAGFGLLELAGLQGDEEQPPALEFVRVEEHLNERRLRVASGFCTLRRLAIEDHGSILQDHDPTGLGTGLLR